MPSLPESSVLRHPGHLEFRLPGTYGDTPFWALSLAESGSMSWKSPSGPGNRERLYRRLGITGPVHAQNQEHTRLVNQAGEETLAVPPVQSGDGLVLSRSRGFLSVTAADCMPIYLWNSETGSIGLLHSGWKGTGILKEAVEMLADSSRSQLKVLLGPAIGSCCYRVDEDRYRLFRDSWGGSAVSKREGEYYLSLLNANRNLADDCGIEACYHYSPCTFCHPEFGSFRREGAEKFTSMLALSGYFQ